MVVNLARILVLCVIGPGVYPDVIAGQSNYQFPIGSGKRMWSKDEVTLIY